MNPSYTRAVALVALFAVLALGGGVVVAEDVTDVGTDHDLDTAGAMDDWRTDGYAQGEADRLQLDLTVATKRADVGAEDAMVTNVRNHFLRLEYHEDYAREVRVLIPRDVIVPYRAETGSLTSDHVADLEPARDGDYLSVTVYFDGPADVVIPLNRDHAVSYGIIERMDHRIEQATGFSPLDRQHDWEYVDGDELTEDGQVVIDERLDDAVVQFDATPNATEDTWLNVPKGQTAGAPVYIHHVGDSDEFTVISTVEDPPDVRYRTEATLAAQARGWVSEAKEIPGNIRDRIRELLPW